ncbi:MULTISPECIES: hypothetical protein [unclassified Curtobacterium]|uniref:hypothetical protein n=1 Tax=unclassified Curtobacterium TaxID=257496 RepID=UPI000D900BA1|nr:MULTISPECIES: hypothetical protein [unclassified Curtobacterium]PYY39155.1 hypothetical protein DEJ32_09485 [Curtobacterium sp. MCPF17_046]WIB16021.1 hypothetical protein DEJ34_02505 [Curtobacterium sp. MCPF17_050]
MTVRMIDHMKRVVVAATIGAGVGALITIAFLVASGVDYRMQEDAGVEPGATPDLVLGGLQAGLWLSVVSVAVLVVCVLVTVVRRRRRHGSSSSASTPSNDRLP